MAVIPSLRNLRNVLQSVLFVPFAYTFFFNMLPFFLTAWENADRLDHRIADVFRTRQNTYDFIVVGGGSAGALVANRLSEYYTVLLIESGGTQNPLQLVPALTDNFLNRQQVDWSFRTQPQPRACLNSINQQGSWSAGRTLGGSSSLGYMTFMRGHPVDFDSWAMITGDRSWSYAEVLPFFRRFEEFVGATTDIPARGDDGELRIRQPDYRGLGSEWVRAGEELGYPNVDFNGRYTEGFGQVQNNIRRGMRQSTHDAFLMPIRLGPKLRVLSHSTASRILFRDMSNMAYGVEFERFGLTELAVATREVILSAGTIGSPKLLMLSGIGPRQHLQELGIPLRNDLPVGRNLQDHLGVQLGPFHINTSTSYLMDREISPENIVRWVVKGKGPLTTTGIQGAGSFSSTLARARGEQNWPDLLFLLEGVGIHRTYAADFARSYNLMEDEMDRYYSNSVGRDAFHIRVVAARPTSTGSVLLSSANARDPAIINPRYLEDNAQNDLRVLQEGVTTALRLAENSTAFMAINSTFTDSLLPGCDNETFRSEAYWTCYIRRFTISQNNPVGTCAMGAVVDGNLKVRGTRGLRVVDASVMPTLVSVGTLPTTLMVAEKAADDILREHGAQRGNVGIAGAVFGRNGIINRNPVQRYLSRELDKLNPLPALFRIPQGIKDFNPFSRFLEFFGVNQNGGFNPLMLLIDFFTRPQQSIFGALLGFPRQTTPASGRPANSGVDILSQLFPFSGLNKTQQTRSIFGNLANLGNLGNLNNNNGNNANVRNPLQPFLELLFPTRRPTTTTTPRPRGISILDLFFPNVTAPVVDLPRPGDEKDYNIFGDMFSPNNSQNLIRNLFFGDNVTSSFNLNGSSFSSFNSTSNSTNILNTLFENFHSARTSPPKNILNSLFPSSIGNKLNSSAAASVSEDDPQQNRTTRGTIPPFVFTPDTEDRAAEIIRTFNETALLLQNMLGFEKYEDKEDR